MKCLLMLFICVTLSACQSTALLIEGSPFVEVPLNSRLVLKQALEIPSGQVAVYLQDGKIIPAEGVRKWQPNCKFEIKTIENKVRKVMPDEFRIYRYFLDTDYVSSNTMQIAGMGMFNFGGVDAIAEVFTTEMFLHSDKQPDVLRLSCKHWEDPLDGAYLTLEQIKQALGEIIEIN